MASTLLHGIYLANYRGIDADGIYFAPLRDFTFLAGQNNVGKSTLLKFLSEHLNPREKRGTKEWGRTIDDLDRPLRGAGMPTAFAFGIPFVVYHEHICALFAKTLRETHRGDIEAILRALAIGDMIWVAPAQDKRKLEFHSKALDAASAALRNEHQWGSLWTALTGQRGGGFRDHWLPETVDALGGHAPLKLPEVRLVPAIRHITASAADLMDCSGSGLVDELAKLQNPPHNERAKKLLFDKINAFLRSITEVSDAAIEVPYERKHLLVHMGDKVLPLSSLGTGIHDVIILASFCTIAQQELICIEEPEIHLHPLLQRKLMRYLRDETNNQYVIATHSASLLDCVSASVFSVRQEAGHTKADLALTNSDRFEICRALGYHASDLLQANAVIWVEGPSDRIYLQYWLKSLAPKLVEGIDFSIMFYGGRLLSHLSANDEEVVEFISLRRLNRNSAILIDSDRKAAGATINATKQRVANELSDGFVWVTDGREIENYLPAPQVEQALAQIYPNFGGGLNAGKFQHRLHFRDASSGKRITDVDKVKVAKTIAKQQPDLDHLDLRSQLEQLVQFIQRATSA